MRAGTASSDRRAAPRVEGLPGQRIVEQGVDGEITPPGRLGDRQSRVARHLEAPVAPRHLGVPPRQTDVDLGEREIPARRIADHLVDRERLADQPHRPEAPKDRRQPVRGETVDFEVDLLARRQAVPARLAERHEVPHPAPDDQGPASGVADRPGHVQDEGMEGCRLAAHRPQYTGGLSWIRRSGASGLRLDSVTGSVRFEVVDRRMGVSVV